MLRIRAIERSHAAIGAATTCRIAATAGSARMSAALALALLAGTGIALSPPVAKAGWDRMSTGLINEWRTGEPAPRFSRYDITLDIQRTPAASPNADPNAEPALTASMTVRDRGLGGLLSHFSAGAPSHEPITEASIELRPVNSDGSIAAHSAASNSDAHAPPASRVILPARPLHATDESSHTFEASAAARVISAMRSGSVAVRAAAYRRPDPAEPTNARTLANARRPDASSTAGWWRGVSEWKIVNLETPPALERLWVRITAPDGFIRGLYELEPTQTGQRVPASPGDTLTIEVDASSRLWGMEVDLVDHDKSMNHDTADQPPGVPIDSVFEEVDRGAADRIAWRSYLICGHAGSEVGVGVKAIGARLSPGNGTTNHADRSRGLTSDPSVPFSLAISNAPEPAPAALVEQRDSNADTPARPSAPNQTASQSNSHTAGQSQAIADNQPADPSAASPAQASVPIPGQAPVAAVPQPQPQPQSTAGETPTTAPRAASAEQEAPRARGAAPAQANSPSRPESSNPSNSSEPGATAEPASGPGARRATPVAGSSDQPDGRTTNNPEPAPKPNPESNSEPGPQVTPGGGDQPTTLETLMMLHRTDGAVNASITFEDRQSLVRILGLDSVDPQDRPIALLYRRALLATPSRAPIDAPNGAPDSAPDDPR
ncbi:MAG: hypothetical protein ACTS3F_05175 [Phycisphaerales bacterium]